MTNHRSLRWVLSLLLGYVGLLSMLLFFENKLVFLPTSAKSQWVDPPSSDIQDVDLICADGTRIHAWWCPAKGSDQALLYCHGNAGNLSHRGGSVVKLKDRLGMSVLIVDYPGYGKSEGKPTEQGCYQSADAAYTWLTEQKKIAPKNLLLYGASLGGGVIVDLASRKDHRATVLVKTFTSIPDVASHLYWWVPAPKHLLMSNRFESAEKIAMCKRPVFIAHGDADEMIPYAHGEKLYQLANEPKQFHRMPGATHNMPMGEEFFASLEAFLREHP